jgi:hypothetical protein
MFTMLLLVLLLQSVLSKLLATIHIPLCNQSTCVHSAAAAAAAAAAERAEQEAADAHKLICGSEDDGFLRFLAANYMSRGRHQQALQCLQRLTVLAPGRLSYKAHVGYLLCHKSAEAGTRNTEG